MTGSFPPEDLECPDPDGCTVAVDFLSESAEAGSLPMCTIPADKNWYRIYQARDGYAAPNPGYGSTRFAPFDDASGVRVPTLYLAESLAAALLEASLRDVSPDTTNRYVDEASFFGTHHARLTPPASLSLTDLRDQSLLNLRLPREAVASSQAEHYACTRRIAKAVHASTQLTDGIIWHSRQAELSGKPAAEVVVLFGDRVPMNRGAWNLAQLTTASGSLVEGFGRQLLDRLADELGVTILPAGR